MIYIRHLDEAMPDRKKSGCRHLLMLSPEIRTATAFQWHGLQQQLLRFSFFNLFLVAVLGVMLRSYALSDLIPFAYKNLLHGHSHFAFGGWIQPMLVWLILQYLPDVARRVAFQHWRNVVWLTLLSAYGMLLFFPVQGYAAISISFSTLAVAAGGYLSVVLWKASRRDRSKTAICFLRTGLVFQVLSFAGPFATGPLIAMGKAGSPLYFDAVYFYLHFQYNGWFLFAVLAVVYALLEKHTATINGKKVYQVFAWSSVPAYFLSVLWHQPHGVFYVMGGAAALVQLIGLFFFLKDARGLATEESFFINVLLYIAGGAFALKLVLQATAALPPVAALAYEQRNFVIAYLHLVLLGSFSIGFFGLVYKAGRARVEKFRWGFALFLAAFITTEGLLVAQAVGALAHTVIPGFSFLLFVCSILFPAGALLLFTSFRKENPALLITGKQDSSFKKQRELLLHRKKSIIPTS